MARAAQLWREKESAAMAAMAAAAFGGSNIGAAISGNVGVGGGVDVTISGKGGNGGSGGNGGKGTGGEAIGGQGIAGVYGKTHLINSSVSYNSAISGDANGGSGLGGSGGNSGAGGSGGYVKGGTNVGAGLTANMKSSGTAVGIGVGVVVAGAGGSGGSGGNGGNGLGGESTTLSSFSGIYAPQGDVELINSTASGNDALGGKSTGGDAVGGQGGNGGRGGDGGDADGGANIGAAASVKIKVQALEWALELPSPETEAMAVWQAMEDLPMVEAAAKAMLFPASPACWEAYRWTTALP
jgi:hypothetical protein